MTRRPTEPAGGARRETPTEVRYRMIRETETFLNERLYRRNGDWATDATVGSKLNPRDGDFDRRQKPLREMSSTVRTWPDWGTLIEVRPNLRGVMDDPQLQALEVQLNHLTDDRNSGDIVIGVQQVAVMTAGLMSLLSAIRPRLTCQRRKLSLYGLRPECASVLRGTGLEELL
jgi:anti-anti-sigma regulatory factor